MLGNRSMGIRPREVAPRTTMASEAMRMAMPLRMARSVSHMGAMDPRGEAEHRSVGDWPWRRARSLGQPPTNPRRARSGPSAAASRGPCPGGSIGGSLDGPLRGLPPKSIARAKPALEAEHRSVGDWSLARDGDGSDLLPRLHEILALEDDLVLLAEALQHLDAARVRGAQFDGHRLHDPLAHQHDRGPGLAETERLGGDGEGAGTGRDQQLHPGEHSGLEPPGRTGGLHLDPHGPRSRVQVVDHTG